LLEEAIHRNVVETKEALEWLVEEGYLIAMAQPHAGRLFQLNTEKRVEAKSFLDEAAEQEPRGNGDRSKERD
jgi:hypothetical protein